MTTLSKHGFSWRLRGLPIWDDYGEVIGYHDTPRWAEADLTPDHWNELAEWFAQDSSDHADAAMPVSDVELVYLLLERNGVEHEHIRGASIIPERPAYGYQCAMCKAHIIAKDPGDFPFYGGPADGRWIVTGGRSTFVVPVPEPLSVMAPDEPSAGMSFRTALYVRDGRRYVWDGALE